VVFRPSEKWPVAADDSSPSREFSAGAGAYQPLVGVLAALVAGIVVDRWLGWSPAAWWLLAAVAWSGWLVAWRRGAEFASSCLLLLAVAACGGGWHHAHWRLFDRDDVGFFADEVPRPACLEGVAAGGPRPVPPPPFDPMRSIPKGAETRLAVEGLAIRDGATWRPIRGRLNVAIDGQLVGVHAGDRVRIFASIAAPGPPANPGEWDYAAHLRGDRVLSTARCPFPDCVTVLAPASAASPARWLEEMRSGGDALLWRNLRHERAGLAAALLLGAREQVDFDRRAAFMETGTIHLLAISGLHVGILAAGLLLPLRLGLLPRGLMLVAVPFITLVYALVTDAQPPVVRATVLVIVVCGAMLFGRRVTTFQSLAAAAVVVLFLNPADLFRVGAQLSFLAVAVLAWIGPRLAAKPVENPLDGLIASTRPWAVRAARAAAGAAWRLFVAGGAISLVTYPLVMHHFHVASLAGLFLNMVLWLPVAGALYCGFGVVLLGWLVPPLGAACGWGCDQCLALLEWCVAAARHVPGSHAWVSGPPAWWLVGFYGALAWLAAFPRFRPPRRWIVAGFAAWIALGLAVPSAARAAERWHGRLDCTFVAVGHGTSAIVELPDGRVVLYDAGQLGAPLSGAEQIAAVLWRRGIHHLDAVIISHADVDHYNALPGLLERFSVGVVYVSPVMFEDDSARAVQALRAAIEVSGVPIRELSAGDVLKTGDDVRIEVLHPPRRGVLGSDNANSLVLVVEYAGRRVLLPGDLETPGLEDVMAEEPLDVDVCMAPHHGSARSSPAGFAAWCTPEVVVISGGSTHEAREATAAYEKANCRVLHTAVTGAVRVTLSPGGLAVRRWRQDAW
jgi:competence protein ComEC